MDPWRAVFVFEDNNGNRGECAVYLPLALSVSAAISKMNAIAPAMQALSNASLIGGVLEASIEFEDAIPPAIDSDVMIRFLAIYRNEVETRGVIIPSPALLPYDVVGSLRAIRLGREAASLSGLLDPLQSVIEDTLTPWGTPHPTIYTVGGVCGGVL